MAKLLVVEDDSNVAFIVESTLHLDGHSVDVANNGAQAKSALGKTTYDLIILDWNLPDITGLEICRYIRRDQTVPVMMLTAKSQASDKVAALDSGADDYVVKPFDTSELMARVRALLRRPQAISHTNLSHGGLTLDSSSLEVHDGQAVIRLSKAEAAILEFLMRYPNNFFATEAIAHRIWGSERDVSDESVRTHIKNLRRKLGEERAALIEHSRGVGYRFTASQ